MRCDLDVIVSLIIISDIEWGQSAGTNLSEGTPHSIHLILEVGVMGGY